MPPPPPVLAGDIWSPDYGLTNRARAKYLLDYNDRDRHGYTKMLKAVNHVRIHLNSIHRGQWNRNRHSAIKEHPPELALLVPNSLWEEKWAKNSLPEERDNTES